MTRDHINKKSQKIQARAPHEVVEAIEVLKEEGESTAQHSLLSPHYKVRSNAANAEPKHHLSNNQIIDNNPCVLLPLLKIAD